VKGAVADPVIRRASWIFVVGSLARASVIARGADPARVSVFANTVDVEAFGAAADALAPRRAELRHELGLGEDDVVVLCVARLSPEKGIDTLLRAVGAVGDPRLVVLLAGAGPERERLVALAGEVGARLVLAGDVPWERIAERYVVADVFALLSTHEPWGVVVNEAAASGLPLVLSDRVGAAYDLLVDGENGALVPAGDVPAAAAALARLAADPALRARQGVASRALVAGWGYDVSVESFVAGVRAATAR
jgi:glycosyltransferase involved in cell wall biosynthesis